MKTYAWTYSSPTDKSGISESGTIQATNKTEALYLIQEQLHLPNTFGIMLKEIF